MQIGARDKNMNKGLKTGLILIAGIAIAFGGAKIASRAQGFADKFKLFTATPLVHKISGGNIIFRITGMRIMNQNDIQASISNLFINLKYINPKTKVYEDLAIQTNTLNDITFGSNTMTTLPMIELSVPFSNVGVFTGLISGAVNPNLKLVTRFQSGGVEIPAIETIIDGKSMAAPVRALLKRLGLGSTQNVSPSISIA